MKNPFKRKKETPAEFIEDEVKELRKEYGRFRRFTDENSLLMGVFLLGLVGLLIINTLFWVQWTKLADDKRRRDEIGALSQHITRTLEPSMNHALSVEVRNVTLNNSEDKAFGVADGETMLIMDIKVTNKSDNTQQLIPANNFYVRSNRGVYSQLHASMHVRRPIAMRDVKPGEVVEGQLSFAVPKTADTLWLYIDTNWENTVPLVIDVLH